jgi:hypothetical protein
MVDVHIDIESDTQVLTCSNCGSHVSETQKRVAKSQGDMIDPCTVRRCENCDMEEFDQNMKHKHDVYTSSRFDSIFNG